MVFLPDKRYYYTENELESLFRTIKEGNARDYLLFKMLFITARRVGEVVGNPKRGIMGLRPVDIDWNKSIITWTLEKRGKYESYIDETGKKRMKLVERDRDKDTMPMDLLDELKEYIQTKGIGEFGRVFPITIQYVFKVLKIYLKKIGIEKKHPVHGLRHTFAIQSMPFIKSYDDLRQLQKKLGHKNISTTEEYLKYKEISTKELTEKVKKSITI